MERVKGGHASCVDGESQSFSETKNGALLDKDGKVVCTFTSVDGEREVDTRRGCVWKVEQNS